MYRLSSLFGGMAAVVVATTALALAPYAALAGSFHATGTSFVERTHGNQISGTSIGNAKPGGSFTSEWSGTFHAGFYSGLETWTFAGGHTLTFFWTQDFDNETGLYIGIYEIMGGTGRYEGATGSGDYVFTAGEEGDDFVLVGTIDLQ